MFSVLIAVRGGRGKMSQLNNVSNKGNGRGGPANWDYVSKYAIFFLDGFPKPLLIGS